MIDNKFAVMKFITRHKLLFGCLIAAWIIGMIFTVVLISRSTRSQIKVPKTSHPLIHPLQHNRLPPASSFKMVKALRYCNPPNDMTPGQEGKSPVNGTLEFVAVMTRHGDRSPLRPVRNQSIINCGTQSTPLLQKYMKTLKYLRGSSKHLSPFAMFPLQPAENTCTPTHMTLLGAHQLLMVGQILHKAYIEDHGLLSKNWTSDHIKLYSTVFSRTFQSAVAFLFTFLPTFNVSNIRIIPSRDDRFCMSDYYCRCPLADYLDKQKVYKKRRLMASHPAVLHLMQKLNPIVKHDPNHSNIFDPFEMFDCTMGYVCHGSHLPCIPGTNECVTFEHVRNLIAYMDWVGRQFVRDSSNTKAGMLNMHGFLNHLLSNMRAYISGKEATRFILYSGHDITLEPLSAALGIDDGNLIPYASRIVFELYSHSVNSKLKYVLKILYNGKDVTKYATFCKSFFKESLKSSNPSDYGICPFESFQKYIEEFVTNAGASSFQALCNTVQPSSYPFEATYSSYVYESYKP
ncbi:2-phosphoxylose phosphatase 1-like isoform X1 [Argiope bruennichi]|uniref:2-phosphoxylose phosphatase 1 n=1 Tax=Argiope bruennichi TaxID=94029 RepID=A0A8T0ES66_ARGBR|nr:2-phosphoxylose phosphatase 1-like isoform X1 [Argiope bruennichi]KAF8778792.1 2-phosphoxylose phosphatase 1 like protein [Argiope bruennichi]